MSGENALKIKDGDYLRFTQDVDINGYRWSPNDLLQVEFTEIQGGHVEWWIRNLAWEKRNVQPSVQKFGMYTILNYAHRVEEINNMNRTVIEHKLKVGDDGWVMINNAPCKIRVNRITVDFSKDSSRRTEDQEIKPFAKYYGSNITDFYTEDKIFTTKDKLLDSLR